MIIQWSSAWYSFLTFITLIKEIPQYNKQRIYQVASSFWAEDLLYCAHVSPPNQLQFRPSCLSNDSSEAECHDCSEQQVGIEWYALHPQLNPSQILQLHWPIHYKTPKNKQINKFTSPVAWVVTNTMAILTIVLHQTAISKASITILTWSTCHWFLPVFNYYFHFHPNSM